MIGSLRGVLADRGDAEITVEVHGVGYRVLVSPTTAVSLGDVGQAHRDLEARLTTGSSVLEP